MWKDLSTAPEGTAVRLLCAENVDDCGVGFNEFEIIARLQNGKWYQLGSNKVMSFPQYWLPRKQKSGPIKDGTGIHYFAPRGDWASI